MTPLGLQEWTIQNDFYDDIYQDRNKTLILKQIMKFQKVKRNHFKLEHKKAQMGIQKAKSQPEMKSKRMS